jgi:hypothetical protein
MSEIIVLGLIPGTHIQITFVLWVALIVILFVSLTVRVVRRKHLLENWIVSVSLMVLTRRQTIARQ